MAVTLRDIAARVGTSEATVSLVLNGRQFHRVSQKMRERIEAVAKELNYRPNRQAQLLAGGKTKTIAVLVNRLHNQFFAEYLSAVEAGLSEHGYHAVPFETMSRPDRAEELLDMIDQRLCDAIIALEYTGNPERSSDRGKDFPLTLRVETFGENHHRAGDSIDDPRTVSVDYLPATDRLFEVFKNQGARRVGILCDTRHDLALPHTQQSARARAHTHALKHLALWQGPSQCVALSQESPLEDWAAATERLLRAEPEIDALLVHNATVTPAVLHQLAVLNRRVGDDIAVATYDDPISARWLGGGLTVVREPIAEVTQTLVARTLDRVKRKVATADPQPALHEAELIIRPSSSLAR
ncbi:MAG: LacI family DNA-binding transcriptional regulator [Planctomycetota bacterium]